MYVSKFSATPCLVTFCTSTSVPVALELLPNIVCPIVKLPPVATAVNILNLPVVTISWLPAKLFDSRSMLSSIVSPAAIKLSTYDFVAASWLPDGSDKFVILNPPNGILPVADVEPSLASTPGPIGLDCTLPAWLNPNLLFTYPLTADSTGTASVALSAIVSSALNSLTTTPRLNPIPSKLLKAIEAANVTVPVPWSTVKNLPTLKKPSWSVLT